MSNFLPNELIKRLSEQEGFDFDAFRKVNEQGDKTISIRLNPFKEGRVRFESVNPVPWCDKGYYLAKEPVFMLDPLYHAGCYDVQEASSMFIAHILTEIALVNSEIRALDLCAASGGKSTLLTSYLGNRSLLVSNVIMRSRVNILVNNTARWGTANVVVTHNDPSAFSHLPGYFDLLLVDAPCSSSDAFPNKERMDDWSLENVKLCSDRQKRILRDSLSSLMTDGYLIYSTSSYSREENEDILDWILSEYAFESVPVAFDVAWGIEETQSTQHNAFGYRFYPHKVKGEAFFVAVLKKKEEQATFNRSKARADKNLILAEIVSDWVEEGFGYDCFMGEDYVYVFPKDYGDDLKWLQQMLSVKKAGTNIGKLTGEELIPSYDLAWSIHVKTDLPVQDVTLDVALQFLRQESLDVMDFTAVNSGWCLVRYKGINLGWIKVLPDRIDNYYSAQSRVLPE